MTIKKHHSTSFGKRLINLFRQPKLAFFVGLVILTSILMLVVVSQNTITLEPQQHFFAQPTQVSIKSSSLLPSELRYTTDGSTPTELSSQYQGPLEITQNSIIQVAAFLNKQIISDVYTFPIFIGTEHDLPVVSIVTSESNLFDENTGIYTNYANSGEEWERPATLSFFEPAGNLGFQKDVGIRIHGGGSRSYPQKSFRIYGDYLKHEDSIKYPLFPDLPYDTFNSFLLRAGGGDWEFAFMRDEVMHNLATQATDIDTQAVRPAVLYLNNQYWGIYYLRERIDQHYLANKYGLSRDKISILEIPHNVSDERGQVILDYGHQAAVTHYNTLFKEAQKCRDCAHYGDFSPLLEMANFRDYMILQLYSGNFDWPFGNVKLWRYEQPTRATADEKSIIDGRLRWIFYDLDVGMGFGNESEAEMIKGAQADVYGRFIDNLFPFRNLFFDEKFEQEYLTRTAELLNTHLHPDSVKKIIETRAASIRSEIPRQVERWVGLYSPHDNHLFSSPEEWEQHVQLLKLFTEHRVETMFEDSTELFDLPGVQDITILSYPSDAGGITIGAIEKQSQALPWQGTFFQDTYVAVEAKPNPGYVFDHWQGDIRERSRYNQRVVIKIADQNRIEAVYKKKIWYQYLIPTWK